MLQHGNGVHAPDLMTTLKVAAPGVTASHTKKSFVCCTGITSNTDPPVTIRSSAEKLVTAHAHKSATLVR